MQEVPFTPPPRVEKRAPAPLPVLIPADSSAAQIVPLCEISFTASPVRSTHGHCRLRVMIDNRGPITAHQPFLCLPLLGLNLEAAAGWAAQDVVAIRKLRRFARPDTFDLPPAQRVHCCSILLATSLEDGGSIEFEHGHAHRFDALPDLRVTTTVGAGNYPSNRIMLPVPGADILRFFVDCAARGDIPKFA